MPAGERGGVRDLNEAVEVLDHAVLLEVQLVVDVAGDTSAIVNVPANHSVADWWLLRFGVSCALEIREPRGTRKTYS